MVNFILSVIKYAIIIPKNYKNGIYLFYLDTAFKQRYFVIKYCCSEGILHYCMHFHEEMQ